MRSALSAVLTGCVVALALPWSHVAIADAAPDSAIRYVALGDSRATGSPHDPLSIRDGCFRTSDAYPQIVADTLGAASYVSRACAGAKTENITNTPQFTVTGAQPPQIGALQPDTTLVTVSIGGNDIAWSSLVEPCYTFVPGLDANCRSDATTARRMKDALTVLGPKVSATLAAITGKSPAATVLVVGHGGIFGDRGCWPYIPTSDADAAFVVQFFVKMNDVLADAARRNGAYFVDVAAAAVGHDACAGSDRRWFEGLVPRSFTMPLHPTHEGLRAMASLVVAARP
ncbi:SGNH/GDSL hydrolase family protein [Rhodococcus opacus]|uniref:SGNH/GDSL hydrolase family protein n=1 Tax=Rhodococcus opacus TaxID=37919 RepID=A0A2S8JCW5_RHOOP|nr:SGNH/GDSL hydrolase family protein [Rhodococcus opacus]PQP24835.1 SGNH/GDSL hydrolase family protein [Rhodococcus opacus]